MLSYTYRIQTGILFKYFHKFTSTCLYNMHQCVNTTDDEVKNNILFKNGYNIFPNMSKYLRKYYWSMLINFLKIDIVKMQLFQLYCIIFFKYYLNIGLLLG